MVLYIFRNEFALLWSSTLGFIIASMHPVPQVHALLCPEFSGEFPVYKLLKEHLLNSFEFHGVGATTVISSSPRVTSV
jgi:hypothetical protein